MTKCLPNHSWKSPQDLSIKSVIHKTGNAVRLKKQIIIAFSLFFVANLSAQSSKNILINEFLASNVSVDADIVDFDDYSDWIELYNAGEVDADLSGYYLTDDPDNPFRWKIPPGTAIKAKGFLRFWADG